MMYVTVLQPKSEASGKREKTQLGNAAAMYEALEEVNKAYIEGFMGGGGNSPPPEILERVHMVIKKVNAALSAPPRNCDVGTPEEQATRFHNFCVIHSGSVAKMCDPKCPCIASPDKCHCLCTWAQMPYESRGECAE